MNFKFNLTDFLNTFIQHTVLQEIGIGCSDSRIIKITKNNDTYFLKCSDNPNVQVEHQKLQWLQGKIPVPEIISYEEKDGINYLLTKSLNGEMVCSDYYIKHPDLGLDIIIAGFKLLKNVDIKNCPFDVGLDYKLHLVKHNIDNHLITESDIKPEILKEYGSISEIYEYLISNRPTEELVFSHGDTSLPNLFGKDDKFVGFIDVAECGIADFWFDVAITAKSIKRNYGQDAVQQFYNKLGREIKYHNIEYYTILMNLYL